MYLGMFTFFVLGGSVSVTANVRHLLIVELITKTQTNNVKFLFPVSDHFFVVI